MARGVRKTQLEKLTEQLENVQASIRQYKEAIVNMEAKEKELLESIEQENFQLTMELMKEKGLTMDDFKAWIESMDVCESESA